MDIESAAMNILKRGAELDNTKRYAEALVCYEERLKVLNIKGNKEESSGSFSMKNDKHMKRAEEIKKIVLQQKDNSQFFEQIHIEDNSTGHSYESLLGRFLDENVQFVVVEDPYIRSLHQCNNFIRLCELLVKSCRNLTCITLITSKDKKSKRTQRVCLKHLRKHMLQCKIMLIIKYSETLHDRQMRLSSGWMIKIGRGLDFYKPPEKKFCLGLHDFDLRRCYKTTVDIVHSKNVKQSYG